MKPFVFYLIRHARIMNIFLWFSGWSHIKSRRCSGAQGLNGQPTVAHICLCYPGHGGLKSLKKKAAGLLRHKRWRVQVFNPSCRFSFSEVLVDLLILIMCVMININTITGVKAWLRFLQEILVKPGADQANHIICWLRQPQIWLRFSHQVVWKLSAFLLKYNSGIWAKPRWYLTPPCHVTYWGHLRHGVSV